MEIFHIIANLLFLNMVGAQIMSKCCAENHEIFISGNLKDVRGENVFCKPANGTVLLAVNSDLMVGLPNCSKLNIIDVYRRDLKISCLDRIRQLNDVYALQCAENETQNSNEIITTVNMRKCCPSNRKYNWGKQYCHSPFAPDDANSATKLIKLAWNGARQFVNMSFGSPHCRQSEVLIDQVIPRDDLEFLNTDSIAIKKSNNTIILSFDEFCVDLEDDRFEYVVVRSCQDSITSCKPDNQICVHKCCPVELELHENQCIPSVRPLYVSFYNLTQTYWYNSEITPINVKPAFLQSSHCTVGKYQQVDDDVAKKYLLTTSGTLYTLATNRVIDMNMYCVDNVKFHNKTRTFICIQEEKNMFAVIRDLKPLLTSICAAISAFFFALTFLIYLFVPNLRNLHGKLIMSYLLASAVSYFMVVVHRTVPLKMYSDSICRAAGYTMLFATLSSFCWLNVISFDIWSTFRITRSTFLKKSNKYKKLIFYNVYGWGYPLVWSIFAFSSKYILNLDEKSSWSCDIGQVSCWFADYGKSKIVYFIIPISLMLAFNAIIFITIVKYCSSVRAELHNTNNCNYSLRKYSTNKNDLMINVKLFVLMGLNWSLEIIALVVQPEHRVFFIISDLFNALVGLIVFCILIMKSKVFHHLRTNLCRSSRQQALDKLTRSNASTSSTNLQSAANLKRNSVHRF